MFPQVSYFGRDRHILYQTPFPFAADAACFRIRIADTGPFSRRTNGGPPFGGRGTAENTAFWRGGDTGASGLQNNQQKKGRKNLKENNFTKAASVLLAVTVVQSACGISAFAAEDSSAPAKQPGLVVTSYSDVKVADGGIVAPDVRSISFSDAGQLGPADVSVDMQAGKADVVRLPLGVDLSALKGAEKKTDTSVQSSVSVAADQTGIQTRDDKSIENKAVVTAGKASLTHDAGASADVRVAAPQPAFVSETLQNDPALAAFAQNVGFSHSAFGDVKTDRSAAKTSVSDQGLLTTTADLNKDVSAPLAAHHDDSLGFSGKAAWSPAAIFSAIKNGEFASLLPKKAGAGTSESLDASAVVGPKNGISVSASKDDKVSAQASNDVAAVSGGAERTKNDAVAVAPLIPVSDTFAALLPTVTTDLTHNAGAKVGVDNDKGIVVVSTAVGTRDKDGKTVPDEVKVDAKNAFGEITRDTKAAGSTAIATGTPEKLKEGLAGKSFAEIALGLLPKGKASAGEFSSVTNRLDSTGVSVSTEKGANSRIDESNALGLLKHNGAVEQDKSAKLNTPAAVASSGFAAYIPEITATAGQSASVEKTATDKTVGVRTDRIVGDALSVKTPDVTAAHSARVEVKNDVTAPSPAVVLETLKGTDGICSLISAVKNGKGSVELGHSSKVSILKNSDGTTTVSSIKDVGAAVSAKSAIGSASHSISAAAQNSATVPGVGGWLSRLFHLCK